MTLLTQAIAGFLPWVREEATLPLATVGMVVSIILGLVFFMAFATQAKLKQDAKRQGVPEYTPEHPAVSRLASKEEIEALISRAGVKVVKREDAHG